MTSTTYPALSFGEGSNGLDALFSTISPFGDADPIMRGIRDGTLSWADASELEETDAAAGGAVAAPSTSAWAAAPPLVRHIAILPPASPPREQRVAITCPGAPKKPSCVMPPLGAHPQGLRVKTLIIRNLPRGCEDLETILRTTFEPYGAVRDVYIPKNMDASSPYFGTIKGFALVKFAELSAAEAAETAGSLRIGRNNLSVEFAKEDR